MTDDHERFPGLTVAIAVAFIAWVVTGIWEYARTIR